MCAAMTGREAYRVMFRDYPDVVTVEQMSQGGSAAGSMFAAGGRAPSHGSRGTARSQMISAPVMAENSLGWN